MLSWALIWANFRQRHIYKTIKDSSYSARPVASRTANIRVSQGRLHRTSYGHSGQPAVPLAPVCERCWGVGGAPGGARASQRVTRPEERRGEERGKVSTTACHRQTDDTSTGLHAGDLAVITPHTHTHTHTHTHMHTQIHACTHTVTRQTEKGARLLNSVSLFLSLRLIIVSCPPWHPLSHLNSPAATFPSSLRDIT